MDINPNNHPSIAGKYAGKQVRCTTQIKPAFDRLRQAALRNHYWSHIAIKELHALTTGATGKHNIYVKPGDKDALGNDKLILFLPGLKATVACWANGQYCVTDLVFDAMYFEATSQNRTRTGLYRVQPQKKDGPVEYVADGQIKTGAGRVVAVADSGFENAGDAARAITPRVMEVPGIATAVVRREGCDLHFTAGSSRLGGLRRYDALDNKNDDYNSAMLLAESMQQARNVPGVVWVADHGGSAILTQAFQILVDRGIKLEAHSAYLNHATSSPGNALRLAHQLGLTLSKDFANTGWSPVGAISQYRVAGARLAKKEDPYNRGYHAQSLITGITKALGPMGMFGAGAVVMGASIPMVVGIGAALAGASGIAGHVGTAYSLGQSVKDTVAKKSKR